MDFKGRTFVIQYPSGRWGFVGAVPMELAYTAPDGTPLDDVTAKAVWQIGPGMLKGLVKGVSFATEREALDAAAALGYREVSPGRRSYGLQKAEWWVPLAIGHAVRLPWNHPRYKVGG